LKFRDIEFTIFDLEWVTKDRKTYIIEIGAVKVKNWIIVDSFDKILEYRKGIDHIVSKLTGITEEMVKNGENRENTLFEFRLFIEGTVLVAHDISNDMRVLNRAFYDLGIDIENPRLCTLQLSQKSFLIDKYNLKRVSNFLDIEVDGEFHRGFRDALLSYKIFQKIAFTLPDNIDKIETLQSWNRSRKKLKKVEVENFEVDKKLSYKGYFDGASSGNPGDMGIGFAIISEDGEIVFEKSQYLGVGTNNEAEYVALVSLLEGAVHNGIERLEVFGDSQLVVKQVNGEWRVKAENLRPFHKKAVELLEKVKNSKLSWVRRDDNSLADQLSKDGVNSK
jgi:ribonuclease HI